MNDFSNLHPDAWYLASSPGSVQLAQIVNKAAQSEMRIGLNTSSFGNVEVRTTVRANDVGVSIGSEKGDLRSLFTSELPIVSGNLQQQSLRLTQVSFHQQGFSSSNNLMSGGDSQSRSFSSKPNLATTPTSEPMTIESGPSPVMPGDQNTGLSILA
ncbi:MAG TPA: flagellar hook-length control protein FliK [Candidatus Sulfotelmatobacter sp.]|nr:flagellar hook-length control protein FliK [Candidatus Sulfotelmatobacter sp.]